MPMMIPIIYFAKHTAKIMPQCAVYNLQIIFSTAHVISDKVNMMPFCDEIIEDGKLIQQSIR